MHKADTIGNKWNLGLMGFNESSGGSCWMCYSYSSYYAEIPNEFIIKNGIKERNLQYDEFTEKWGTPIKGNNPSIPILVKPNISNNKEMLDESPYYFNHYSILFIWMLYR